MLRQIYILICLLPFTISGCAHTPGDAVLMAGNPKDAAWMYAKGAELGDGVAAFKLGQLIKQKLVSEEQYGSSFKWDLRACDLGYILGCHNVAIAYQEGTHGQSVNFETACKYYLKSAEGGYMPSQYNLSLVYSTPQGMTPNYVEAYKWFLIARNSSKSCRNDPKCEWVLRDPDNQKSDLKSHMTAEEIRLAESLAASWRVKR